MAVLAIIFFGEGGQYDEEALYFKTHNTNIVLQS